MDRHSPPYREASFEGTLRLRFFDAKGEPVPKVLALSERMQPLFEDVDQKPIVPSITWTRTETTGA